MSANAITGVNVNTATEAAYAALPQPDGRSMLEYYSVAAAVIT